MAIDVHAHYIPPAYLRALRAGDNVYGETIRSGGDGEAEWIVTREGMAYPISPHIYDPGAVVAEQERLGFGFSVLSPPPTILHYGLEKTAAREHCRMINEGLAELQRQHATRLACLGTLPLSWPEDALDELNYVATRLPLRGIIMCSNILGKNLDEPELLPVFMRLADLGMPVLVHPWYVAGAERMRRYHLFNAVGNPLEITLAFGSLVLGGVMDRCPGLKVLLVHAGGAAPYIIGRLNRAWRIRPELREKLAEAPQTYLHRFHYDSIAHDNEALLFLLRRVGPERVMLGSDMPFHLYDMGDPEAAARAEALAAEEAQLVRVENARRFFGLAGMERVQP